MDKFLEMYSVPRLNQEEIENMNRQITINEIELVLKQILQKSKNKWLHRWILANFFKKIDTYSSQTIQKNCRAGNASKLIL